MAKKVVVVRVGEKTTRIVHMENGTSNPTVFGCVRIATPDGAVNDGVIVNEVEIAKRIQKACLDKNIHTKDVIFTIESGKIASRETTIPAVAKNKQDSVVMAKVPDMFPVDVEKYIFAYKVQGQDFTDEEEGKMRNVRIFAAPSELVESYYRLADEAGLTVVSVEADVNAIFQIVRRQVKGNGVTMCIQIGRDSTLVNVVTADRMLLQRVIPYGVSVFTEAMIQEPVFDVEDYDAAFKMLSTQRVLLHNLHSINPGNDFSTGKRIEVTDNGEYLISNISRVMEYYGSNFRDQDIQNVILVGSGCSVAGLHELLTNELNIEVTTPTELSSVRFNKRIAIDPAMLQYLSCFGSVFSPADFVPKAMSLRDNSKGSMTGAVLAFAGLTVLGLALAGISTYRVYKANSDFNTMEARHNALKPVEAQYEELCQVEADYELIGDMKIFTASNNNDFHALIKKLSSLVPKSFTIQNIKSDENEVTISATSKDRLSSLSMLQMQLNKMDNIKSVKIDSIADATEDDSSKRVYVYTMTFEYVTNGDSIFKDAEGGATNE